MITLALLLASDQAAPPPAPPPIVRVPAPAPPSFDPLLRREGFSEEAIAVLKSDVGGFGPRVREARDAIAAVELELRNAMDAPEPDLEAMAGLMRRRDQLLHRQKEIQTEQVLAVAAALPLADRKIYLRHANRPTTPRLRPRAPMAPPFAPPPQD